MGVIEIKRRKKGRQHGRRVGGGRNKKNQFVRPVIIMLVVGIMTIGIYWNYGADTVLDIKIADNFYIDPETLVSAVNISDGSENEISLGRLEINSVTVGVMLCGGDNPLAMMSETQKEIFVNFPIVYADTYLKKMLESDTPVGFRTVSLSVDGPSEAAGHRFTVKVPQGLYVFGVSVTVSAAVSFPAVATGNAPIEMIFSAEYYGFPEEVTGTDAYSVLEVEIFGCNFNETAYSKYVSIMNTYDPSDLTEQIVDGVGGIYIVNCTFIERPAPAPLLPY